MTELETAPERRPPKGPPPDVPVTATIPPEDDGPFDGFINLVAALLKQAALDVHDRDQEVSDGALAWFMDEDCRKPSVAGGITFCWVADVFDLDPDFLRTQLFAWSLAKVNSRRKNSPPPEPVLTDEDFVSIDDVAEEVIYDYA
jgi:hypothetical protein